MHIGGRRVADKLIAKLVKVLAVPPSGAVKDRHLAFQQHSKSGSPKGSVGSNPTFGTSFLAAPGDFHEEPDLLGG